MIHRLRKAACSLALLSAFAAGPLSALEPYLVKDIDPYQGNESGNPRDFVALGNGITVYIAGFSSFQAQLWRTDGTTAGTYRLLETCGGQSTCGPSTVVPLGAAGDRFYFRTATSPEEGPFELWVTSGSPADTFRLADPVAGTERQPSLWIESRDLFFFAASDQEHGTELWRSDGTPAGTYRVSDIRPGTEPSFPWELVELGGRLYFTANDGSGPALWTSDGTPQGTKRIKDLVPGSATQGGALRPLRLGARLLFTSEDGQLWRSDGTAAGTTPVLRLAPAPRFQQAMQAAVLAGRYYFTTRISGQGEELWVSDGTGNGTRRLTNFAPEKALIDAEGRFPYPLPSWSLGSKVIFHANDGAHGFEPWITDGTVAGTRLLRDICPGACPSFTFSQASFGARMILSAEDPVHGRELWITNGTTAGTRLLKDICPGSCSSRIRRILELGGQRIFVAEDPTYGGQVWKTNGTPRGTVRVTGSPGGTSRAVAMGVRSGGAILFSGYTDVERVELWRTDGTAAGTGLVYDIAGQDPNGSRPERLFAAGDRLFFTAEDREHGRELWSSDGTEAGTSLLFDRAPEEQWKDFRQMATAGGLFFVEYYGLLRSDGTAAGTFKLTPEGTWAERLKGIGNHLFFRGQDEEHGGEPWVTDGMVAGTRVIDVIPGSEGSDPEEPVEFQGKAYFVAMDVDGWERIWRSDGTEAGTTVTSIASDSSQLHLLGAHAGRLWYLKERTLASTDGTSETLVREIGNTLETMVSLGSRMLLIGPDVLWVSDGTATGTRRLATLQVGRKVVLNGRLVFESWTAQGDQTWISDGTPEGTKPLQTSTGQTLDGSSLALLDGRVWLSHRGEIWHTDGTPGGTVKAGLIGDGPTAVGSRLFFVRQHPDTGSELWAVEP
jgi:ELWxxDGT repeat protein